jgi:hypothetical protein
MSRNRPYLRSIFINFIAYRIIRYPFELAYFRVSFLIWATGWQVVECIAKPEITTSPTPTETATGSPSPTVTFMQPTTSTATVTQTPTQTSTPTSTTTKTNFNIPSEAAIDGIEVRLDAKADSTNGSPKMCVEMQGASGTWSNLPSVYLGTSEATYILGSPSDTWGLTWSADDFSNANYLVRIYNAASSKNRDFFLDWIAVNVYFHTGSTGFKINDGGKVLAALNFDHSQGRIRGAPRSRKNLAVWGQVTPGGETVHAG